MVSNKPIGKKRHQEVTTCAPRKVVAGKHNYSDNDKIIRTQDEQNRGGGGHRHEGTSTIQNVTKRGDHMKAGRLFLDAFDFPTLSFIAAILAALSAALLFVRGVIVGPATLLGLGFGLSGLAGDMEREALVRLVAGLLTPLVLTPLEFVFVARRTDVERVPVTDAGRVRPFTLELEVERVIAGGLWWRTDYAVRKCLGKDAEKGSQLEGGGVHSFMARSAALRLVLGETVGVFVLATEMVSLRL